MTKYFLNPDHINDQIITKTSDGTEILITKDNFNDYFAELMIKNGQSHLVVKNGHYTDPVEEKKSYTQLSPEEILLTSRPEQIGKEEQKKTVKEPGSRPKRGRPSQKKE